MNDPFKVMAWTMVIVTIWFMALMTFIVLSTIL